MGRMTEQHRQRVKLAGIEADERRMRTMTSHELSKDIGLMVDKGMAHTESYKRACRILREQRTKEEAKARQMSKAETTR